MMYSLLYVFYAAISMIFSHKFKWLKSKKRWSEAEGVFIGKKEYVIELNEKLIIKWRKKKKKEVMT